MACITTASVLITTIATRRRLAVVDRRTPASGMHPKVNAASTIRLKRLKLDISPTKVLPIPSNDKARFTLAKLGGQVA